MEWYDYGFSIESAAYCRLIGGLLQRKRLPLAVSKVAFYGLMPYLLLHAFLRSAVCCWVSDGYVCTQIPAFFTATGLLFANKAVVKRRRKSLVKQKDVFRFIKENAAGVAVQVCRYRFWECQHLTLSP